MKKICLKLSQQEQFELLCSLTNHLSDPRITSYPKFFTRSVSKFSSRKNRIEFSLKEEENMGMVEFPVQYKGSITIKDSKKKAQTIIKLKMKRGWTIIDHICVPFFATIFGVICSLFNFTIIVSKLIRMITHSMFFGKIMNIHIVKLIFRGLHSFRSVISSFFFHIISPNQLYQLQHSLVINILFYTCCLYLLLIPLYNLVQKYLSRNRAKELFTELLDCCITEKVKELK